MSRHISRPVLLFITGVSLICSAFGVYMEAAQDVIHLGAVHLTPEGGFTPMAVFLLVLGANVYTLKLTGGWEHWRNLALYKKAVAAITIVIGLLVIVFLCLLLLLHEFKSDFRACSEPDESGVSAGC